MNEQYERNMSTANLAYGTEFISERHVTLPWENHRFCSRHL